MTEPKITPCNLDLASPGYERPDADGCVFLLHRAADGRRLAKGRLLPDGSLEIRDGAVPDKATMRQLEEAASAFQRCDRKRPIGAIAAEVRAAFDAKPKAAKTEPPAADEKPKRKSKSKPKADKG